VPVIAGIGHDKDVPLLSLAADKTGFYPRQQQPIY